MSSTSSLLKRLAAGLAGALLFCACAAAQPAPGSGAAANSANAPQGVLTFRLRMKYLQPAAVTVTEGRYFINVVNELVLGSVVVQVDDGQNARLANAQIPKGNNRHSELVDLKPGAYTVRVVGKPTWSSTITVTKKEK